MVKHSRGGRGEEKNKSDIFKKEGGLSPTVGRRGLN